MWVFPITVEDAAILDAATFDEVWAAMGIVARARGHAWRHRNQGGAVVPYQWGDGAVRFIGLPRAAGAGKE